MTNKPKKFLSYDSIEAALAEIALSKKNVALVGGVAMQFYGSDRLTVDVDIISDQQPPKGFTRERKITFGGFITKTPHGLPVDWIVRNDDFKHVYREALKNSKKVADIPIPIVSLEYLLVLKMIAGRQKDEDDIMRLLQNDDFPRVKAKRLVKKLLGAYGLACLQNYLLEADWRKASNAEI